jgi:hypothetical protein
MVLWRFSLLRDQFIQPPALESKSLALLNAEHQDSGNPWTGRAEPIVAPYLAQPLGFLTATLDRALAGAPEWFTLSPAETWPRASARPLA